MPEAQSCSSKYRGPGRATIIALMVVFPVLAVCGIVVSLGLAKHIYHEVQSDATIQAFAGQLARVNHAKGSETTVWVLTRGASQWTYLEPGP